jgi:hypothetical protein
MDVKALAMLLTRPKRKAHVDGRAQALTPQAVWSVFVAATKGRGRTSALDDVLGST